MSFPEGVERVSDLRMEPMDESRILRFFDEMGFQDIRRRFQNSLLRGKPAWHKSHKSRTVMATSHSPRRPRATIPRPEDYEDVPF
jgi:hypothetical protein